uniref:Uncharacterized protein n=1 Tax=Timema monikensis TaxID=170555 RepID=A0A7R9E249_9NEOP|nr:unnamed protein product [Timema monikensis]
MVLFITRCFILSLDVIVENFGDDVYISNFTKHCDIITHDDGIEIGDSRIRSNFLPVVNSWRSFSHRTRVLTKGDIPPRSSGSCGILLDDFLYVFGGFCHYFGENAEGNSNMLHRLHIPSRTWELLNPAGRPAPTPCDKLAGWVYKDKLYFFGGFGPRPDLERFQYEMDQSTVYSAMPRGWNNQLVVYNTATNCWEWPKMKGPIPSPRAAHAADITGHKAFIFGGRFKHRRTNDLHSLDLETHTWSGNLPPTATQLTFAGTITLPPTVTHAARTITLPPTVTHAARTITLPPTVTHIARTITLPPAVTHITGTITLPPTVTHAAGTITLPPTVTHAAGTITLPPTVTHAARTITLPPAVTHITGISTLPPDLWTSSCSPATHIAGTFSCL